MPDFHTLNDMTLSLRKLRQFLVLAEEGNFTRAAERLSMSQPSLSRSIAQLEELCGLRLFDRGRLGVTLTSAGADLALDARQVLGQVRAIEQNLSLQSRGEAGRIAMGIGPLATSYLATRLLVECVARWPSLRITVLIDTTDALIERLLDGTLDFCICAANALAPNAALAVKPLGMLRLGYFVRAAHPLARATGPLDWDSLAPFPRAAGTSQPLSEPVSRGIFGPLGTTVICNDYELLRQITAQTDTIWLASDRLLEQEIANGEIVEIRPSSDRRLGDAAIALVRLVGRSQSPAMLRMIEAATTMMAGT